MNGFPIARLYVLAFSAAIASSAVGFYVLMRTGSIPATGAAIISILLVSLALMMRWWQRIARAAGYPSSWTANVTPRRLAMTALGAFVVALTIALEMLVYALTNNRVYEALVALVVVLPGAPFYLRSMYAMFPEPTPFERALVRSTFYLNVALLISFAGNLTMQLVPHRVDDGLTPLRNFTIAMYLIAVPAMAINVPFSWQRRKHILNATSSPKARVHE